MKRNIYILTLSCLAFLLGSCKQDNWLDWKVQNELWMEQNAKKDGIHITESGLQYEILYEGITSDTRPNTGATVVVDYKGTLINGRTFDSGNSVSFICAPGSVITGFAEGLRKMHKHADYIFYIPWELAYGEDEQGADGNISYIPPYSTLIFEVHLSDIIN